MGGKARVIQQGRRLASVDSAVFASSNQCSADEPSAPVWSLPASLDCRCRKSASKFRIMVGGVVLDEDGRDWTGLTISLSLSLARISPNSRLQAPDSMGRSSNLARILPPNKLDSSKARQECRTKLLHVYNWHHVVLCRVLLLTEMLKAFLAHLEQNSEVDT